MSGDRSNVYNGPSSLFGHIRDDKLCKSHRGKEIGFKRLVGSV